MLKKILAAAAIALPAFATSASQLPDYPFIHVGGNGFAYVRPDVGEIDFEISAHNAEPEAARTLVEARIAEVRALVAGLALPEADVEIRDVRREIRKGDAAQSGGVQYDLKCGVHIKVADLSKWKALVSPLINMPNLDGFMTGFDASRREQLEAELMGEAIKAARLKGEAMAAGFGRKLGAIGGVSAGDLKNVTRAMGLAATDPLRSTRNAGRNEYDRDSLLMINTLKMSQSVDVIFRIK
ncbi:MAG: SIMPL domain-containing protein [Pseudomonadota bacterium]|nr:SIMPL domain-containing protein [Pseudomonadota bacterium]